MTLLAGPVKAQSSCTATLQSLVDAAPSGGTVDVPACTYRELVTISKPITLDGHNRAIIDGDHTRDRWVWITSSDVTVRGFTMRNTVTSVQEGALGAEGNLHNLIIDHNDLSDNTNGSLIGIGLSTDSRITNNQLHGGGQLGIGSYKNVRLTIQGNHIYGNNTAGNDPYWEAGGIKAVLDIGLSVSGNEIDHNNGPGVWIDIQSTDVAITDNVIHDQAWNPVFFEISSRGEIARNTISASNQGQGNWGCIVSSSSAQVTVHDNTCTDTLPLKVILDNRSDSPPSAGTGNILRDNRLIRPTPNQATDWWQYDPNGPLVVGKNGNMDVNNSIAAIPTQTALPTATATATPQPTQTPVPTATPTSVPTATVVPTPRCMVNIRLDGVEGGWKAC